VDKVNSTIKVVDKPKVLMYINEGLMRLYSTLNLKEKDFLIEMVEHITFYHLLTRFSESGHIDGSDDVPYIKDLEREPFKEDIIKILKVYSEGGYELPFNNLDYSDSVFSPEKTILQIPRPSAGKVVCVVYQASHPKFTLDNLELKLELPEVLHEALYSYVAFKCFSYIGSSDSLSRSVLAYNRYEYLINQVKSLGIVTSNLSASKVKFITRGFV
jgi:hypothetical protein